MEKQVVSRKRVADHGEVLTGKKLCTKHALTEDEVDLIESLIRPMEANDE